MCSIWSSSRPGVATRISTPPRTIGNLLLDVDAAVDHGRAQVGVFAVGAEGFLDLHREFAGGREDQRAHRVARRRVVGVRHRCQFLQDRQGEAGGLAGAGLGATHHVLAGEYDGDCLHLDRCGRRIAGFFHGPQQLGPQSELGKARCAHECSWSRPTPWGFPVQAALIGLDRERTSANKVARVSHFVWAVTGTAARNRIIG